jgi:hypothetical protein
LDKNWTYYGKIFFLFLLLFFIFFPKLMKNYLALKMPGHAGDLFNDAISKLLRIQRKIKRSRNGNNTTAIIMTTIKSDSTSFFPVRLYLPLS